jgi:predicted RND superfamily exporter protein
MSNFIPTIYFGIFTGLAMFIALLAVLVLMPRLILIIRPFGDTQRQAGINAGA